MFLFWMHMPQLGIKVLMHRRVSVSNQSRYVINSVKYIMKNCIGCSNLKWGRKYILKPTVMNESLHETSNIMGAAGENFATSKMKLSVAQCWYKAFINTLGHCLMRILSINWLCWLVSTFTLDVQLFTEAECNAGHFSVVASVCLFSFRVFQCYFVPHPLQSAVYK